MALTDQINYDIKTAMKARDKQKLEALRGIKSALMLEDTKGAGADVTDETAMKILQKLLKQRLDSFEIYKQQGRDDLAAEEKLQADVIASYLPKPLSEEELRPLIAQLVKEMGAAGMKDMGRVMGAASKIFAGKAPGKLIAGLVKEILNG